MSLHGNQQFDRGGFSGITDNAVKLGFTNEFSKTKDAASSSIFSGEFSPASLALSGLETLGSIWNSFQQMKLAKKTFKFQKNAFKTNLANSTKVYNTALEDRIRARFATEGRPDEADAQIARQRL